MTRVDQHNLEIQKNVENWRKKPVLREVYRRFWQLMAVRLAPDVPGEVVELGSGIGNIREVIPQCVRTDLFANPWVDRVENAYRLNFGDESVSSLILFDVFHHLRYPGTALKEFLRVLKPGGRVIVFEPCISLWGLVVYGIFHDEPLGLRQPIEWLAPDGWSPEQTDYYAAEANATRIFLRREFPRDLEDWAIVETRRMSAISYVMSGGYSKPQLYPDCALPFMRWVDAMCDLLPSVFATRLLAVLQKRSEPEISAAVGSRRAT